MIITNKSLTKHVLAAVFLSVFALATIMSVLPARADQSLIDSQTGLNDIGAVYGNTTPQDIRTIVGKIINIVLGFLGVIFLALTVFAGFQYMTSGGNEEKNKKAIALLTNAVIGLVIILAAWLITRFTIIILNKTVNNNVDYKTYYPYGN
jgi:hypothetical protein